MEQRDKAVSEVYDGATVIDVARRYGVARQTVHDWLRRHAAGGMAALADGSPKPSSCGPPEWPPRSRPASSSCAGAHRDWGPHTRKPPPAEGFEPGPGRSSIYRCLVRHGEITPQARRRKRSDCKRWERSQAMELWQMDVVGGVRRADGTEAKVVTGIDDHSQVCVSAYVVPRHRPPRLRRPGFGHAHPRRARAGTLLGINRPW